MTDAFDEAFARARAALDDGLGRAALDRLRRAFAAEATDAAVSSAG
jgi:hypothetical protein